jgi:predicted HTH domain antitoxin
MKMFPVATASLLIALVGPLSAQVLHFEGRFTEFAECPRNACDFFETVGPLPFSFDVELQFDASGRVDGGLFIRDPSGWPRLAFPTAIEQQLQLIPSTLPRAGDYLFQSGAITRHSSLGFQWIFEASEAWDEPIDDEGLRRSETRSLAIAMFRSGGVTFEQASRQLTKQEVLGFLQDLVGQEAELFRATNGLRVYVGETVDRGSFNLNGSFKLVSICPAPTGLRKWLG